MSKSQSALQGSPPVPATEETERPSTSTLHEETITFSTSKEEPETSPAQVTQEFPRPSLSASTTTTTVEEEDTRPSSSANEPSRTTTTPVSLVFQTRRHLAETVRISTLVEIELLLLTFCIGIQDAISFPDYHCFASNQTGNTVFLAVALVIPSLNGDTFYTANIAVALGLFLAGGYLTGQLSHLVGPRRRGWLVLCNLLQTLLALAAGLVQWHQLKVGGGGGGGGMGAGASKVPPTGPESLVAIALLAFASGSQVVQSRSLRMTEISTAMATAAWVDLLIDPHLMVIREPNRPRNRRLAFLVTLVAGSLVGAGIYRTAGSATAVFVSAGGKALVTVMYLFNGTEEMEGRKRNAAREEMGV